MLLMKLSITRDTTPDCMIYSASMVHYRLFASSLCAPLFRYVLWPAHAVTRAMLNAVAGTCRQTHSWRNERHSVSLANIRERKRVAADSEPLLVCAPI